MPVLARLSITSPLAADQALARLASAVGPPDHTDPRLVGFEFLGMVRTERFQCRRYMRSWSRIVAPDVEGHVVPTDTGSRIDAVLRPRPEILLILLFPAVPWLRGQITEKEAHVLIPAAFALVVLLTAFSLWWELVKARRFLRRVAGTAHPSGTR
jgi:hypothetical protein